MSKESRSVVDNLRYYFSNPHLEGLGDWELLRSFVETDNGDAFVCLVRRHGPMVLGLARRIVSDYQLAEDVFQATFLVLGRKARAIRGRESLAAWLHRITFRLAVRAKQNRRRCGEVEAHAVRVRQSDPLDELTAREFLTILDEELNNLPDKYRLPLILCHLEGLTREEAAKRLGLSLPSVKARLERGRERMRLRLIKRGLASGAAVVGALQFGATALAVPPALVQLTLRAVVTRQGASLAATAMANGVIKMMLFTKIQSACLALVVVSVVGWGAAWLAEAGSTTQQEKAPLAQVASGAAEQTRQPQKKGVDLYGDPLPEGAVMRLGTVQLRAAGAKLALSPDGKTIVGVRGGNVLSFWDVTSGKLKETRIIGAADRDDSILSTDGLWLATDRLVVWDVTTGNMLHKLDPKREPHTRDRDRAFSPDGSALASVSWQKDRFLIRIWDLRSGKETFSKEVQRQWEGSEFVSFTPDGKKLVVHLSGSPNIFGTYCWDVATGELLWRNRESRNLIQLAPPAFSADGSTLLSSEPPLNIASGNTVQMGNLPPLEMGKQVIGVPDGKTLLVENGKGVLVWDMAVSQKVRLLKGAGEEMLLTRDGKTLVTNNGSLQHWDLATGKQLYPDNFDRGHRREVTAMIFSADGRKLASAAADGSVRLWDVSTGRPVRVWSEHEPWRRGSFKDYYAGVSLDMTPDGRWIVSGGNEEKICVWDTTSGMKSKVLSLPPEPRLFDQAIEHLRISHDGTKATALFGGDRGVGSSAGNWYRQANWLGTWDLQKGTLSGKRSFEKLRTLRGTALSRDGKTLLASLSVLDLNAAIERAHLEGAERNPVSTTDDVISLDGSLVARDFEPEVHICEMATGKRVVHLKNKGYNCQMAFHPNNRHLAIDDVNTIKLWDLVTGKLVATREVPKGDDSDRARGSYTSCLAFTPNGRRLATGHPDGTILLWNIDLPISEPVPLAAKDIETLWNDLLDADAAKSWRSVWRLVDSPNEVVPFLRERVKAFAPAPEAITRPLLADLESESFARRDAANKRLLELGIKAETALRARLKDNPSLETQRRIESLLKTIVEAPQALPPQTLRDLRAVAVLTRINTPEARNILQELAKGVESARLTGAASAALGR